MDRMAPDTSRLCPGGAIASWRRFRGRAIRDKHWTRLGAVFRMLICTVKMGMVGRDDDVFKLSALLNAARFVTIVGSGRETLQVEGERVYRLDALACPPDDTGITAAVAQTFAAPKLFVERARRRAARTWTSAMRKPQSWSASAPGTRGDASSGGAGCIIDVHARQQRSGACVA
jgi:hypothetical protein